MTRAKQFKRTKENVTKILDLIRLGFDQYGIEQRLGINEKQVYNAFYQSNTTYTEIRNLVRSGMTNDQVFAKYPDLIFKRKARTKKEGFTEQEKEDIRTIVRQEIAALDSSSSLYNKLGLLKRYA